MNKQTKDEIFSHLVTVMEKIIKRRTITEPFNSNEIETSNPFGFRLVPIEVWKGAKFERSFVTSLGQGIFEQIGKIIAIGSGAEATNQYSTSFDICTWRLEKIDSILKNLRNNTITPNWQQEVNEVLSLTNDRYENVSILSDLHIRRPDGSEEFYTLKTVKPNLDQSEHAKRDMLRIVAGNSNCSPYFALPFNPAGEGNSYRSAKFTIPYKIFDLDHDSSVLIGASLWNKIGNDPNTYNELLKIFEDVGKKMSPKIKRDYFNL